MHPHAHFSDRRVILGFAFVYGGFILELRGAAVREAKASSIPARQERPRSGAQTGLHWSSARDLNVTRSLTFWVRCFFFWLSILI